jgi:hypothetical protein
MRAVWTSITRVSRPIMKVGRGSGKVWRRRRKGCGRFRTFCPMKRSLQD